MSIYYTFTDESPALATFSFLPIAKAFLSKANIDIKVADISLSARILAEFEKCENYLELLGELVQKKDTNIIKTPNISASIPQLKACILELQKNGFDVPDYEKEPQKYAKILGSAVNPVLRQGNSIRKSTKSVKNYAKANPYKITPFDKNSKTRISSMDKGDFFDNEKAVLIQKNVKAKVVLHNSKKILKEFELNKGDILDASFLSSEKLNEFYKNQIKICKDENILFSLHLKATMMKISDPVIFGQAVKIIFDELFKIDPLIGFEPKNGVSELLKIIEKSPKKDELLKKYNEILNALPLSFLDSINQITSLHVPSDVIVDASMPAMLKNGAKLWDKNGKLKDTNALIPDRTYAGIYKAVLDDMKKNKELNPSTLGSVSNIGLMAKKAQEYGSHDKTFILEDDETINLLLDDEIVLSHEVKKGDIYRINIAKNEAVQNWIDLAKNTLDNGEIGIFWLDENRPSDKIMIDLIKQKIQNANILSPKKACEKTLEIIRSGKDCVSISGNVLRDYLTDLFPILELGTSAKMLSIVPMLNGGAMFETGAGGSAPKQVSQLLEQNHLRWDSLGEFLALFSSLEYEAKKGNKNAEILAFTCDKAIEKYLNENKAPSKDINGDDNRISHFYFALFWAKELANQTKQADFKEFFTKISIVLEQNKNKIIAELSSKKGERVDIGGYYYLGEKAQKIMRPSQTFNDIIAQIKAEK